MKKILVADDHALIRDGLRTQLNNLESGVSVIEAHDWNQTFAALAAHKDFDLALVDLKMPGHNGHAALAEILQANPGLPIVVLSASDDLDDMRSALRSGAMGYLTKSEAPEVMRNAVRLVLEGGMYVPPALAMSQLGIKTVKQERAAIDLTDRQRAVLRLIVEGKSNKEIAQLMSLAPTTVKVHLAAVLRALNVENRTQAAIVAERLGLHHDASTS